MSNSKFLVELHRPLIADASFIINLNATEAATEILQAIPHKVVITDRAFMELEKGERFGHDDATRANQLIAEGLIKRVLLGSMAEEVYERLVSGNTEETLDDGEAATIAYALETSAIALIDERKARRLCGTGYPDLDLVSSAELLLCPLVKQALGATEQIEAIMGSLLGARMRVPLEHIEQVVATIGSANASRCSSLPRSVRI